MTAITVAALNIRAPATFEETELIHLCNTTSTTITVDVFRGGSAGVAAGTELFAQLTLAPKGTPGSMFPWPYKVKLTPAIFLSARASAVGVTATVTVNAVAA